MMDILLGIWISITTIYIAAPNTFKRLQEAKLRHRCSEDLVRKACREICRCDSLIYNHFNEYSVLGGAVYFGITEIVKIMIEFCPDLIWHSLDQDKQSLLHYSIINRREEIFNLFSNSMTCHKAGPVVGVETTMLHLVSKLAPHSQLTIVSGAALQMQRELQWFKVLFSASKYILMFHFATIICFFFQIDWQW